MLPISDSRNSLSFSSVALLGEQWYTTALLSLPIFQVPAAFPTPIQHFSHSITPSSLLLPWILLSYTCMHLHTPSPHLPLSCQGEEVERQRAEPSGSWCFIFFKSLSGLVVCMADSLDLIPGLIQSLFQISLVHHAMPWHSSDAPVYIISGQIYARLNIKSHTVWEEKNLSLFYLQ